MVRLGFNSNGFQGHRLGEALGCLAELGYRAVAITPDVGCLDPRETGGDELTRIAARCRFLGLEVVVETGARFILDPWRKHRPNLLEVDDSWHVRLEYLLRMLEWCDILGARVLSFWSGALPENQTEQGAEYRLIAALEILRRRADELGVVLGLEPEPGHWIATLSDYARLRNEYPGLFKMTLDVGHILSNQETEPHQAIHEWRDEIVNLQLDDMRWGEHLHLAPGEGQLNWVELVRALKELDLQVPACFELSRDGHRFHELAPYCMQAMRQLGL